jgi:hypothetical protein
MSWRNKSIGLVAGCAAMAATWGGVPSRASADDAPLTVTPAVLRVDEASPSGATTELVRYRGWYGPGWGGRGYYRGYGYRGFYRPYYRPFYRPFYGAYYGPGYGYAYPGYGYGYGYRGW